MLHAGASLPHMHMQAQIELSSLFTMLRPYKVCIEIACWGYMGSMSFGFARTGDSSSYQHVWAEGSLSRAHLVSATSAGLSRASAVLTRMSFLQR